MSWIIEDRGSYIEVKPTNDAKDHYAGDECWCDPLTERHDLSRPLISHNHSGETLDNNWRDVSYATNLFMLRNGFSWSASDQCWSSKPDKYRNILTIPQNIAEYFVGALGVKPPSPTNQTKKEKT